MSNYIPDRCNFGKGDCIDSKYIVDKILGEGTFGVVYRVKDNLQKTYALKLLKLWEVHPPERKLLVERFKMEYETGKIASKYLVQSYAYGFAKGNPYILMEYCENGDIVQLSKKQKVDWVGIGRQILYGLRDLHTNGKIHRDLKPENVLVKQDNSAVLTDFGISGDQNKRMTERGFLGKPKQIFGTYGYMPPEQVNPKRDATVLPTTDIFSFGVLIYQMLTGNLPFGKLESENDLILYIKNGKEGNWNENELSRVENGTVWKEVIRGCLVPDFKKRFQSIDKVLEYMPQQVSESKVKEYKSSSGASRPQMEIKNGMLLRIMQGVDYGKAYYLNNLLKNNSRVITIGRENSEIPNTISIKENNDKYYISRKHCTLEWNPQTREWHIRDGEWDKDSPTKWSTSLNGTYVNATEVSIQGMTIAPGDIISIGEVKLRVEGY